MPKKIPKVIVNGKEFNQCPLCGVGVNTSAWGKWKMCIDCNKLAKQGISTDKIQRIRATEISGVALDTPTTEELVNTYKRVNIYNFRTTFPPGVRIMTRDSDEAKYVQEVYNYYSHYSENVPEFNVLISGILQAKLDLYRNSKQVSEIDLPYNERKGVKEIDIKLGQQINTTSNLLNDLRDRVDSQAGNILTNKFGSMAKYLHDCEQEYTGLGLCEACNTRIIFKTNFPTFKTWMFERLDRLSELMVEDPALNADTVLNVMNIIKSELTDYSLAETYVTEHVRELESTMFEAGVKTLDTD
jgi:hypothetical protein